MTIEELKQRLEGIRWFDKEICSLYLELQYLETGLFKQTTLTQARVQTSRVNSSESQLVAQLTLKEDITSRIDRLTKERLEVVRLIDKLKNPIERTVLRMFYVNCYFIQEVADRLEKSRTTVYGIRSRGLENLAKELNNTQ